MASLLSAVLASLLGAIVGWFGAVHAAKKAHELEMRNKRKTCRSIILKEIKSIINILRNDLEVLRSDNLVPFLRGSGGHQRDFLYNNLTECIGLLESDEVVDFYVKIRFAPYVKSIENGIEIYLCDVDYVRELLLIAQKIKAEEGGSYVRECNE